MARTSGFFEAMFDSSLQNPETGELGDYDRKYLASEFARYFSMIIGNGIVKQSDDSLKVIAGVGYVTVKPGFAFINGYWFNNSEDYSISVSGPTSLYLTLRYSNETRMIDFYVGTDVPTKTETIYDLILAKIDISGSQINVTDFRNTEHCGYVLSVDGLNKTLAALSLVVNALSESTSQSISSLTQSVTTNSGEITKIKNGQTSVGQASKASKLADSLSEANVGSTSRPVYFKNGIPVQCGYTVQESVPQGAKFTDTTYNDATQSSRGLMTSTDKKKVDSTPTFTYQTTEPTTVKAGEIVFVYED